MPQIFNGPFALLIVTVSCGIAAALGVHSLTNWLRLYQARLLHKLGLISLILFGLLTLLLLAVARVFGTSPLSVLWLPAIPLAATLAVSILQRRWTGVPVGIGFSHLCAEAFAGGLILWGVSTQHNTLAEALCGGDKRWERFGVALEQVGALLDVLAIAMAVTLLLLELMRSFGTLIAQRRAADH